MSRFKFYLFAILSISIAGVAIVSAQSTTAGISGSVRDTSQAVVPGTSVVAKNLNTGIVTEAKTNDAGVYQFPSLQIGVYDVTATSAAFQTEIYKNVDLQVNARLSLDFVLKVASAQTEVSVSAAVDQLQEVGATVGAVIENQKLTDLPMGSLDATNLDSTIGGVNGTSFAGAESPSLNISRDGISIINERGTTGNPIFTGVNLVDEIKVVVSPADAEFSRGSGQVIISTKAGTNGFHGQAFGTLKNEALNANDFFSNMKGLKRAPLKREQYGAGLGGPIKRNKTFFYFLYDAQRQSAASSRSSTVLTSTARQGIFRFYPGVKNGNTTAAVPTVDAAGNPVTPKGATGALQSFSVFGLDPARMTPDKSGYIAQELALDPLPNDFSGGDGLNTASYTWNVTTPNNRDQYNTRIDHNFNNKWRLTGSFTWEKDFASYSSVAFPESYQGTSIQSGLSYQHNYLWNAVLTTIVSPTVVNEFTYGGKKQHNDSGPAAYWYPNAGLFPKTANGQYFNVITSSFTTLTSGADAHFVQDNGINELHDALTYTHGGHTFKAGVNYLLPYSGVLDPGGANGDELPKATLGAGGVAVTGVTSANIAGLGSNQTLAQSLLTDLTGSVASENQVFNINKPTDSFTPYLFRIRKEFETEMSWFVKDDWKVTSNLTLNIGVRWDYFGVPYDQNGLSAGLVGGSKSIFGIAGTTWSAIDNPTAAGGALTQEQLIGKNSPNPGILPFANDMNNFGPAVGLSWSIPYFGRDKTVLRAGYSIVYPQATTLGQVDSIIGSTPGVNNGVAFSSASALFLSSSIFPLTTSVAPLQVVPLTDRTQAEVAYDSGTRDPYVQNWNMSIDRQLPKKLVLSVRYIGSKGTKLIRGINVDTDNIFENGILNAFQITQAGGNAPLFNQIFNGLNLGTGVVNGTTVTGSQALRSNSTTAAFLANNNVGALANFLNSTSSFTNVPGGLLRNAGLPEDFIVANPQYASANLFGNYGSSTYHSAQLEVTKRLSSGWTLFANYTFSKALGESTSNGSGQYTDPRNWSLDKARLSFDQTHALKMNGTYQFPFGHGRAFLNNGHGILTSLVADWQTGGVMTLTSGSPISFTSGDSSFTQGSSNAVLLGGLPSGKVTVTGNGVQYFPELTQVTDPSVSGMTAALANTSTQLAIKGANGQLLMVNPTPGTLGAGSDIMNGPPLFELDMNLLRRIKLKEKVTAEFRFDATDVLNHPRFGNPTTSINSTSFGRITSATGNRVMIANLRITF